MDALETWLTSVIEGIMAAGHEDFAGLGLVFYTERDSLPVHPLTSDSCGTELPATNLDEVVAVLSAISRRKSACHDGFHLVNATNLYLTDVSQFLSPPIPDTPMEVEFGGARQMAARLFSMLPEVQLTATYTSVGEAILYEYGKPTKIKIAGRSGGLFQ